MSLFNGQKIYIGEYIIKNSDCKKLLDIKIDSKLRFDDHVQDLCKKANRKLLALDRATPHMYLEKRQILINPVFDAQFN